MTTTITATNDRPGSWTTFLTLAASTCAVGYYLFHSAQYSTEEEENCVDEQHLREQDLYHKHRAVVILQRWCKHQLTRKHFNTWRDVLVLQEERILLVPQEVGSEPECTREDAEFNAIVVDNPKSRANDTLSQVKEMPDREEEETNDAAATVVQRWARRILVTKQLAKYWKLWTTQIQHGLKDSNERLEEMKQEDVDTPLRLEEHEIMAQIEMQKQDVDAREMITFKTGKKFKNKNYNRKNKSRRRFVKK